MTGIYVMLGGMVLFGGIICIYDFLAERQQMRERNRELRVETRT